MVEISGLNTAFKFDLIEFARGIIKELDAVRSYQDTGQDNNNSQGFHQPAESRLNTFLRLVGLPYFVSMKPKVTESQKQGSTAITRHLTPGYDSETSGGLAAFDIKNDENWAGILADREGTLLNIENSIGSPVLNDYMSNALFSPIGLQANLTRVGHASIFYGRVLTDEEIGSVKSSRESFKRLIPLIPSYIKVLPKSHDTAKPFLPDLRRQILDEQTFLPKPLIENIIRIRLTGIDSSKTTAEQNKQDEFIEAIKGNDFVELNIEQLLKTTSPLERFIVNKLLTSVNQLAKKWTDLERQKQKLVRLQGFKVNVKTSSARSPLGKRAEVETNLSILENSNIGKKLSRIKREIARNEALFSLLPTDDTVVGLELPRISKTKNIINSALIGSFTSILGQDIQKFRKEEKKIQDELNKNTNEIEKYRLEVEMMTGEFSGLSVLDVIAVIIGLFFISRQDLINLLDSPTKRNMLLDKSLKSALEAAGVVVGTSDTATGYSDAFQALQNLESVVEDIFDLINLQVERLNNKNQTRTQDRQTGIKKRTTKRGADF